jgi:hypothetical protein
MSIPVGDARSSSLLQADGLSLRQFETTMAGLGQNRSRARVMADYAGRIPAMAGGAFGVAGIATGPEGLDKRLFERFCHMLERANWSWVSLRRGLLASAIATGIIALTIEIRVLTFFDIDSDEEREDGRDIIALVAIGEGRSTPVGWACVEHPPLHVGHCEAIRGVTLNLIEELAGEWPELAPGEPFPPIVSADTLFGEDRDFRAGLAGRHLEYHLPLLRDYDEVLPVFHPYENTKTKRTLAELMPGDPEPPSDLLELGSTERSQGEFALALPGGRFALIHPEPVVPDGALLGHHPQIRARELVAVEAPAPTVIDGLRVADFKHASQLGVIRHAWLVSTYSATSRGRFTDDREERR